MIPTDKLGSDFRTWARAAERVIRELQDKVSALESQVRTASASQSRAQTSLADLREFMSVTLSSNTTLGRGEMCRALIVNCSTASNLTLPTAEWGMWTWIVNIGSEDITLKNNGGTTMVTVRADHAVFLQSYDDGSGNPEWQTKVQTVGSNGREYRETRIIWGAEGPVVKDSGGTYWEIGVSTLGALTTTSLGSGIGGLD